MIRKRPKHYPYTKSQYEYSYNAVYAQGENKPYFKTWVKKKCDYRGGSVYI